MKQRHYILLMLMLLMAIPMAAQNDFGMDFGIDAEKKICRGIDFELAAGARTQNNTRDIERLGVGGTFGFKVINGKRFDLKLSAGWEYIWQRNIAEREDKYETYEYLTPEGPKTERYYEGYNETRAYWRPRHRTTVAIAGTYKPNKRWNISLKESFQYNHYNSVTKLTDRYRLWDEDDPQSIYYKDTKEKVVSARDRFVLRSKLSIQYDIRHCPLAPFVSGDYGCGLNYVANKWKVTAGTDIKLNKTNKFSVFYRFQTETDDDEPNGHLLGIAYSVKL